MPSSAWPRTRFTSLWWGSKRSSRDRDLGVFSTCSPVPPRVSGSPFTPSSFADRKRPANLRPREMHVVFLDNGRSDILKWDCREILRCIRCGACQNVCPVYRQASGHAYRATYGGPIGAVLSPLLAGDDFASYADLPKASSLCGACREACPVDIPIPDMLLKLRHRAHEQGIRSRRFTASGPLRGIGHPSCRLAHRDGCLPRRELPVPASMIPVPALGEKLAETAGPAYPGRAGISAIGCAKGNHESRRSFRQTSGRPSPPRRNRIRTMNRVSVLSRTGTPL